MEILGNDVFDAIQTGAEHQSEFTINSKIVLCSHWEQREQLLHTFTQLFACLEVWNPFGRHADRLPCLRVTPLPWRAMD